MTRHWNWHGIVAIILALGVSVTLVLEVVNIILRNGHTTETEATLLATAFGAAIGAIATYLGGTDEPLHRKCQNEKEQQHDRT